MSLAMKIGENIGYTLTSHEDAYARMGRFASALERIRDLADKFSALPSVDDIGSVTVGDSFTSDADAVIRLYLKQDRQDSPILREMVQVGIVSRITKSKHWDGKSLDASFEVDRVSVEVSGYVPQSCRMVEEEVEEVLHDVRVETDEATGLLRVVRMKKQQKIVCVEDGDASEATEKARSSPPSVPWSSP